MPNDALARVETLLAWLEKVRVVADPSHPLGRRARRELPEATGLSQQNVDFALDRSLEVSASREELRTLVSRVSRCDVAHVLLSANLFTSPLRAITLALAAAPNRFVRPSRRDPLFTSLLKLAAPESFELVECLSPHPNEHVWAYGSDETMQHLVDDWPDGVVLHAHGHGFGVIALTKADRLRPLDFDAIALDVSAFDQRGCLSPRIVLIESDATETHRIAQQLFSALERINVALPLGRLTEAEWTERARHRDLWRYLGSCLESTAALVSVDVEDGPWTEAPNGRVLHVKRVSSLTGELREHEAAITTFSAPPRLTRTLEEILPRARSASFGWMQRPPLDGPADRRGTLQGHVLRKPNTQVTQARS